MCISSVESRVCGSLIFTCSGCYTRVYVVLDVSFLFSAETWMQLNMFTNANILKISLNSRKLNFCRRWMTFLLIQEAKIC